MAFSSSEYLKLRQGRADEISGSPIDTKVPEDDFTSRYVALGRDRIASKMRTQAVSPNREGSWFEPGAFRDGYQFGDVTKTILGTVGDVGRNVVKGGLNMAESAVDAGAFLVGGVGGLFGADDFKSDMADFVAGNLIDEEGVVDWMDNIYAPIDPVQHWGGADNLSVLGEKSDSLVQSATQLAGTAGLQAVGVPWWVTTGATSFGGEAENALNEGASFEEAGVSALISAGSEILTEKLFGGSGLGEKGLFNLEPLTKEISSRLVKALAEVGVDMTTEGIEEVVSQFASNLGSALYKEEALTDILFSEEAIDSYIDSYVSGAFMGGFANVSKVGDAIKDTGSALAPSQPQTAVPPQQPQSALTDLVDDAIASAHNAPSDPLGAAVDGYKATGTITNNQARDILNNTKAISQLIQQTGVKLPDTAAGRRTAVKEAVAQLAQQSQDGSQADVSTGITQNVPAAEDAKTRGQAYADALLDNLIPARKAIDTTQNTDYDNQNTTGGTPYGTREEALSPDPGGIGQNASRGSQARQGTDGFGSAIRGREEASAQGAVRTAPAEGPLTTTKQRYTEEDYFTPKPGSPLEQAQQATLKEYGVASRVIKQSSWKEKGLAASDGGIIYFCETIDAEDLPEAIVHELVHVMKQNGYQPYLDFIQSTPDCVDLQNPVTHVILKDVADHRGIDYFSMDDLQVQTLYDELNAAVYGAYKSGQLNNSANRAWVANAFYDLDSYLGALDNIHEQYKTQFEEHPITASVGAAPADFSGKSAYNDLLREGNVQPDRPGDVRPMEVPKTDSYGRHVSETAANLYGAEITPDETASRIEDLIAIGALGFDTKTNKQMVEEAAAAIKKNGVAATEKAVTEAVFSGRAQDSDIVKAALLYTTYANRKGDAAQDRAAELAVDLATMANDAGRRLQLFKLIRKMTPQGQLMAVQKGVQRSVERINKGRGKNNQADVTIPQELVDEYLDAAQRDIQEQTEETAREKETIEQAIYKAAAAQIKASPMEKLNAWRYMAMLGNAKTQVRNIFGNAAFRPMVSVKRAVGAAIEHFAVEQENRTKAVLGTGQDAKALLKWAQEDAKSQDAQQALSYSSQTGDAARDAIQNERQIFDTQWLETVRKTTQEVPEYFDMVFKSREYAYSLASFVKARGYTSAQITANAVPADVLNAARSYATQEALKATFNDHNAISDLLSRLRYRGNNAFGKAANILGEGVLPFRRTPANILVRGLEYSPANVVRSAWNLSTKVRAGEMSAATAIDQMASGLTGTAAMVLGYALASGIFGIRLRGKIEDEDEKRMGHQEYALEIGDQSYTIDWLAPVNIPLFVGANIYETNQQSDASWLSSVINASGSSLEPMLELSCLSSLNDLFESAKYAEEGTELWSAVASAATSYMTQFIPTLFGQVEQATEAEKQSAYSSAATPVERSIEKTIGRMTQRIPGLDLFQAQKYDAWGNGVETSNAYQSFINPAYASQITNDPVDQEISRLNKAQSENVSPSLPSQSITYTGKDGQAHKGQRLTAEEYEAMCRVQGQTQKRLVEEMISSADYADLSDADKAKAISYAYDYARDTARLEVFDDYPGYSAKWMAQIDGNAAEAILRYAAAGTTEKYADLPISTAAYVDDLLKSLRPEDGHTSVRTIQKMEAVVADDRLASYVDDLLRDILPDSTEAKYDKAINKGFTAEQFVEGYRQYTDAAGANKKQSVIRYCQREMGMSYAAAKKLYDIYNSTASAE